MNCTGVWPNARKFSDVCAPWPVPFGCQTVSWPVGCPSAGTMIAIDFLGNSQRLFPTRSVCWAWAPLSECRTTTRHQSVPVEDQRWNLIRFLVFEPYCLVSSQGQSLAIMGEGWYLGCACPVLVVHIKPLSLPFRFLGRILAGPHHRKRWPASRCRCFRTKCAGRSRSHSAPSSRSSVPIPHYPRSAVWNGIEKIRSESTNTEVLLPRKIPLHKIMP